MFFSDTLVFGFDRYLESDIFALEKCTTAERKSSLSKKVVAFLILSTATLKSSSMLSEHVFHKLRESMIPSDIHGEKPVDFSVCKDGLACTNFLPLNGEKDRQQCWTHYI